MGCGVETVQSRRPKGTSQETNVLTEEDLRVRLAVGRGPVRLSVEACHEFPGFSRSVFVFRTGKVLIEFGVLGGVEGTLRLQAGFDGPDSALEEGVKATGRSVAELDSRAVVDPDWLPQFPEHFDLETSEIKLRGALAAPRSVRDAKR